MKHKNNSIVFILVIFTLVSLTSCVSSSLSSHSSSYLSEGKIDEKKIAPLASTHHYELVEINEEKDFLITNISYPSFPALPALDKHIKNLVESGWNDFKKEAEKQWKKTAELNSNTLPPFEYFVKFNVLGNKDIVSIYLEIYSFNGGAHGETHIKTINYDIKNDKYLSVTEATNYSYDELSEECNKILYEELIEKEKFEIDGETVNLLDEMRREGTKPIAGNYEAFTIDNENLTIYFEDSKVAPHYYGIQTVSLKMK